MKLTPIKVRGKGPRTRGFVPPNRHKRPKIDHEKDSSISVDKKSSAAAIERLPVEIIQRIFIFSREHNFPRASLRIGKLLSHPSFRLEMILQAFAPTWDAWFGCAKDLVHSYHGWFEDSERFGGDPKLQSQVIALPWMNHQWITDAIQVWVHQSGRGRHYLHSSDWRWDDYPDENEEDNCVQLNATLGITAGPGGEGRHLSRGFDHVQSAADCFNEEYFWMMSDEACGGVEHGPKSSHCRLEAHPSIRIPDRLITGPLTSSDVKLLFWLVHNNATLAEDQGWELTLQGIDNLFKQNDGGMADNVTQLLVGAGAFKQWPQDVEPVSTERVSHKLHQSPEHDGRGWEKAVRRIFGAAGPIYE